MALIASDQLYIVLADNNGDTVQSSFRVGDAITLAERTAILDAVKDLSVGVAVEQGYTDRAVENAVKKSASLLAETGIRWRAVFQNANGSEYTQTIGCADLSLRESGTELMDNTSAEYLAFKAAVDGIVRDPDGNTMTLMRVEYYKA